MKECITKGLIIKEIKVTLWLRVFLCWCLVRSKHDFSKVTFLWTLKLNAHKNPHNRQRVCSFPPSHTKFINCISSCVTVILLAKAVALRCCRDESQVLSPLSMKVKHSFIQPRLMGSGERVYLATKTHQNPGLLSHLLFPLEEMSLYHERQSPGNNPTAPSPPLSPEGKDSLHKCCLSWSTIRNRIRKSG